jgi:hypothetical protein
MRRTQENRIYVHNFEGIVEYVQGSGGNDESSLPWPSARMNSLRREEILNGPDGEDEHSHNWSEKPSDSYGLRGVISHANPPVYKQILGQRVTDPQTGTESWTFESRSRWKSVNNILDKWSFSSHRRVKSTPSNSLPLRPKHQKCPTNGKSKKNRTRRSRCPNSISYHISRHDQLDLH